MQFFHNFGFLVAGTSSPNGTVQIHFAVGRNFYSK